MTSNTESSPTTAQSAAKSTSSPRQREAKKLPKAKQLKVKINPVEHCKETRGMVLELRENLAKATEGGTRFGQDITRRVATLEQMKVVRAWPIYTALALEAAAIAWIGAKLYGYLP